MTDIKLLPLPEVLKGRGKSGAIKNYARANVAHATAAQAAEIEALRAEVGSERAARISAQEGYRQQKARAERLAEALSFARDRFAHYMDDSDRAAFDAALAQEGANG